MSHGGGGIVKEVSSLPTRPCSAKCSFVFICRVPAAVWGRRAHNRGGACRFWRACTASTWLATRAGHTVADDTGESLNRWQWYSLVGKG
jgi:hypothetical protein